MIHLRMSILLRFAPLFLCCLIANCGGSNSALQVGDATTAGVTGSDTGSDNGDDGSGDGSDNGSSDDGSNGTQTGTAGAASGKMINIDASGIAHGWASDSSDPSAAVVVRFYLNGTSAQGAKKVGETMANQTTNDASVGAHGFNFQIPASYRDGNEYWLFAEAVPLTAGQKQVALTNGSIAFRFNSTSPMTIGYVDTIDASGQVDGWAIDMTNPATSVTLHFYVDGPPGSGSFAGSTTTSIASGDLNSIFGATGTHRFQFSIPLQYRDGHQHAIYAYGIALSSGATNPLIPGSPRVFNMVGAIHQAIGWVDSIDGNGVVYGWAIDESHPSQSIAVHFYLDGAPGQGVFMGATTASIADANLNAAIGVTGAHRFAFTIPGQFRDGKMHAINAYGISLTAGANNPLIPNSPKYFALNAAGTLAIGWVDKIDAHGNVVGWAADLTHPNQSIAVHLYVDGQFAGQYTASVPDNALNGALGTTGAHRFSIPIPDGYRNAAQHVLQVYAITLTSGVGNPLLGGSGKIFNLTGTSSLPIGYLDNVDSNGVAYGWAADLTDPGAPVTVHFYVDGQYVSAIATAYVDDALNSLLGTTGAHRFVFQIPAQYRGALHHLNVYGIPFSPGIQPPLLPNSVLPFQF